jgi:hypothetical protein
MQIAASVPVQTFAAAVTQAQQVAAALKTVSAQKNAPNPEQTDRGQTTDPSSARAPTKEELRARLVRMYDNRIFRVEHSGFHHDGVDPASLRRAKARMIARFKFEDEHGFTQQTTTATKSVYAAAKAGRIHGRHFSDKSDAIEFARSALSTFQSYITDINLHGKGDAKVGGGFTPYTAEHFQMNKGDNASPSDAKAQKMADYWNERNKDMLTASRMYLFAEGQEFTKTFAISGGLLSRSSDGQLQLGTFDISYNGHKLAQSIGDGTFALYRPDGTLAVNRYA